MPDTLNPDPFGPHRRAADLTWIARIYAVWQRVNPFISMFVVLFLAFGFKLKTPAAWFNGLEARVSNLEAAVLSGTAERREMIDGLEDVKFLLCATLEPRDRERQLICQELTQ